MTFPVHPDKFDSDSILTAADIVAYRARLGRTPGLHSPQGALFCLERGLPRRMRRQIPVRQAGSMNAVLHETKKTKSPVVVLTDFGGGAPIVAELAEELVVMGVRKMVLMTWGGALQPGLKPGDIVVCDRAVRDDGVSHHYLPPGKYVGADAALSGELAAAIRSRGADCLTGATWTTDAPYRETRAEVAQYQSEGVQVVEMESSGLFTIGQVRGVQTASVVVVMDSLAAFEWQAPDRLDGIVRSLELVYRAALDVLGEA
ncbi:MAG: nucleoside phosphorylase [Chloroflexota bacterium]